MLPFSKYQGAGNDFILFDDRTLSFPQKEELIHQLCDRRLGVGADGLILLQQGTKAPFRMRIFNADGKEVEMCGNGLRCLTLFLRDLGFFQNPLQIETEKRVYSTTFLNDRIAVEMGKPEEHGEIELIIDEKKYQLHLFNTGVPHAVIFVENIWEVDVEKLGKKMRYNPIFDPVGVNLNFVSKSPLSLRTYERGVEAETLACGTGVCAVAAAIAKIEGEKIARKMITASKEILESHWEGEEIILTGPAILVFKGNI